MKSLFAAFAGFFLLAGPVFAQSNADLNGCSYPHEGPAQALAERIMTLPLPYLDKQFIHYRNADGEPSGAYSVRRSLRIFFYDAQSVLIGTAVRRSQTETAYFDPDANILGVCVNHKLVLPDDRPVRFDPRRP